MRSTQENVSILADLPLLTICDLLHLVGEVGPHAGVHRHCHVTRQRPHFLPVLLQGFTTQLDKKESRFCKQHDSIVDPTNKLQRQSHPWLDTQNRRICCQPSPAHGYSIQNYRGKQSSLNSSERHTQAEYYTFSAWCKHMQADIINLEKNRLQNIARLSTEKDTFFLTLFCHFLQDAEL